MQWLRESLRCKQAHSVLVAGNLAAFWVMALDNLFVRVSVPALLTFVTVHCTTRVVTYGFQIVVALIRAAVQTQHAGV